jgi:hypothetical protein
MGISAVEQGEELGLVVQIEDGTSSGLYPRAIVTNDSGSTITGGTVDLTVAGSTGMYYNAGTALTMPNNAFVTATYIIYTDSGHTTESSTYMRSADVFMRAGEVSADVTKVSGSSSAADKLEANVLLTIDSSVNDGSATITSFDTNLTETGTDAYINRELHMTSGTAAGEISRISAYNGSTKVITLSPGLKTAPANTDTFTIF